MQYAKTDNEEFFTALRRRPFIAWPTVILLGLCWLTIVSSWYLVLIGTINLWQGAVANCIAYYYLFAPIHDSIHRAISTSNKINDLFGFIAIAAVIPIPAALRWARLHHMQHHIHCGDTNKDPDIEISSNAKHAFSKWWVWGAHYFTYYPQHKNQMPKFKTKYLKLQHALLLIFALSVLTIFQETAFWLWIFPSLFMAWNIAFIFSFLPHHTHPINKDKDRFNVYQTTCNRVGWEWLASPLFQYQNYHLVHHLYPTVPFYRYVKIWNARKTLHENEQPAMVKAFTNKPLNNK